MNNEQFWSLLSLFSGMPPVIHYSLFTLHSKDMEIRKSLESPIRVGGFDAADLILSLLLWIGSCILVSLLRSLFAISPYFYLLSFVSLFVILILLKRASKRKHPSFLRSEISWKFMQATDVFCSQPLTF